MRWRTKNLIRRLLPVALLLFSWLQLSLRVRFHDPATPSFYQHSRDVRVFLSQEHPSPLPILQARFFFCLVPRWFWHNFRTNWRVPRPVGPRVIWTMTDFRSWSPKHRCGSKAIRAHFRPISQGDSTGDIWEQLAVDIITDTAIREASEEKKTRRLNCRKFTFNKHASDKQHRPPESTVAKDNENRKWQLGF